MKKLRHTRDMELKFNEKWPFCIEIVNKNDEELFSFNRIAHSTGQKTIEDCENAVGFKYSEKNNIVNMLENQKADIRLFASAPDLIEDRIKDYKEIGKWLSAALEDDSVCKEMKEDITRWFDRFSTFERATGYKISEVIND